MTNTQTDAPWKPLRLKAGIIIVALQWLIRFVIPFFVWEFTPFGAMGGMLGWLALVGVFQSCTGLRAMERTCPH